MRTMQQVMLNGSMGTTANSLVFDIRHIYCFAIQASVVGTAGGTIQVQGSNDMVEPAVNGQQPTNWANVGTATTLSQLQTMINLDGQGYAFVRVAFTSGGSGTLTVILNAKGA